MDNDAQLLDGEERNRQHPDSFAIPSLDEKRKVQVHDRVKIGIEPKKRGVDWMGERIWVRVTGVQWPRFVAEVTSPAVFGDGHGVYQGSRVEFEARHIIDIDPAE